MGGITQLTQDVLAGPGSGSKAATVVGLQTRPVGAAAPSVGDVLTWNGAAWVPAASPGGAARTIPVDANDIIQWTLDDASVPWVDSISGVDLYGYQQQSQWTPFICEGQGFFGSRAPYTSWQLDTGLFSTNTAVGENPSGTVHGWVNLAFDRAGTLVSKNTTGFAFNGLELAVAQASETYGGGLLSARIGDSGVITLATTMLPSKNTAVIAMRQWTHVALTWSSGSAIVYVNGVAFPLTITYTSIPWDGGTWSLGKGIGNLDAFFDQWRVCNVARSAAYIDEVYKRGVGRWP